VASQPTTQQREAQHPAAAELPRTLVNTADLSADDASTGAIWKLTAQNRDLDANIIALPPNGGIEAHAGPDLDVMIHVLAGSGRLTTESSVLDLAPGDLVWLPRQSRRQFRAGDAGLRYLTVHRRREALVLRPPGAI
jgi:quercetin dioxygenase-like cupin family protein